MLKKIQYYQSRFSVSYHTYVYGDVVRVIYISPLGMMLGWYTIEKYRFEGKSCFFHGED